MSKIMRHYDVVILGAGSAFAKCQSGSDLRRDK